MTVRNSMLKSTIIREEGTEIKWRSVVEPSLRIPNIKVSVIIPVYNEEETIKRMIDNIPNHFKYEIIIVDDGSTDKSVERIKEIKRKGIKIIQHKKNRGYGAAIQTGLKYASGDIIVTIDSDGQHEPKEIPELIFPIIFKEADMVIGSRYLGSCDYNVPIYTKMGEFVINLFLNLFYGQNVSNNQSGFRAFKKEDIKCLQGLRYTGMGFTTEFLLRASSNNLKLKEVPINLTSRKYGISKVKILKLVFVISGCLMRYAIKKVFRIKAV
ncbi:MAG: glycosyltransferase family 2 protein [Candidatus Lokiarchaeota archaeon]